MNDASVGLVYAHVIAPENGKALRSWDAVANCQPDQGILWVHLDADNDTALAWLAELRRESISGTCWPGWPMNGSPGCPNR